MSRSLAYIAPIAVGFLITSIGTAIADTTDRNVQPIERLEICGSHQPNTSDKTCIVDGDTLWLNGVNIRLQGFDTPESRTNICGGFTEIDLANAATDRLQELLNNNPWSIELYGVDGTGTRRLATIRVAGEDVGETLIRERLARYWPDGPEFWCR
ncbi:thermonuclease family protein [Jannaschia sp. KMU-145]|uniref:thermonuclease family protein n=1 Tax=Jannaschia halovivens TaxID=3388667 RepID=UPI00396B1288